MSDALNDFWDIYDAHYDAILAETLRAAEAHAEFGPILRAMPREQMDAENRRSREQMRRAIAGDRHDYEDNLRTQGASYAKLGVTFAGWYDVVRAFQQHLVPRMIAAYGDSPARLAAAINAMQAFLDDAMAIIAESYHHTKDTLAAYERLRLMIEGVEDYAILMLDPDGKVATWNKGAERIKGYAAGEIIGRYFACFYPADDVAAGKPEHELEIAKRAGRFEDEGWRVRKDGSRFWANSIITALYDDHGTLRGFGKVTRDHSERRRTEEERAELNRLLVERNEALTRASRAKSDFLAMMSHELRTPLNAIIGFSEVLSDGKFGAINERQARYLSNIHDGGRHLLGLINDLLDLSKIEAGRLEVSHTPCALRALAAEAVATVQQLADLKRITLRLDGAPPPLVAADPFRVKQVLYNLLSNAIKFTPDGGAVAVELALAPDGRHVRTTVSDTGCGIAPHDLARLFKQFSQLDNAGDQPRAGTGLGLALTKQLVELMHGRVGVDSTLGAGSRFYVDLPLADPAIADATPRAPAEPPELPLALVVDDDPKAVELIELALRGGGYRTLSAATGEAGLAIARAQHPQVITLDVFLPGIDGWDVLRALRGDPATAAIPVVLVTIGNDRSKAFSLGAVEHLTKPFDRKLLLDALDRRSFTTKVRERELHVLAIDDDPWHLELVRAALEPRGFRVRTALSGREGLDAAAAGPVDLLLLDLVLPDISGVEVVAALRRDEKWRELPILLITGNDLSAADRKRLNGDVEAVLAKGSLSIGELLGQIDRVLRKSR